MTRRKRHVWWRMVAIGATLTLLGIGVGAYNLLRTPGWYRPPIIADAERQQVRDDLMLAQQQFTEGLRLGGGPFVYNIPQRDVNRWLTMRRGIYPAIDRFRSDGLEDPFLMIEDGCLTISGRTATPFGRVVISVDVEPTVEDGALVLRAKGARCGSMPVPLGLGGLDSHFEQEAGEAWEGSPRMSGDLINGVRIDTKATWWNGRIDYRVLDVWIEPGVLHLEIESLGGRHTSRRDQD